MEQLGIRRNDMRRLVRAALNAVDEWSFEMNTEELSAVESLRGEAAEPLESGGQCGQRRRHGGRQKTGCAMTRHNSADDIQSVVRSLHDVHAAAAMDMRLDKSRSHDQRRCIDSLGSRRSRRSLRRAEFGNEFPVNDD